MRNVVLLLGGESSGKTTLAKALEDKGWHAVYEYGREYGDATNNQYTLESMSHIAKIQSYGELVAIASSEMNLVVDTNALVTEFYSRKWFGEVNQVVSALAREFGQYTHIVLLKRTFPFVQDGTRQDEAFSDEQFDFYRNTLGELKLPYTLLGSDVNSRVSAITYLTSKPF